MLPPVVLFVLVARFQKGICLQNIEITHNYPEKEDEANCFAQKCMLEAGFNV